MPIKTSLNKRFNYKPGVGCTSPNVVRLCVRVLQAPPPHVVIERFLSLHIIYLLNFVYSTIWYKEK